jgi:myo-inositol-1(or 4)-monophosphatase
VTECDLAVNALLEEQIRQQRPEDGWLSEETPDEPLRLARERLWIIDPIDGTRAFIEGREEWCVAAALSCAGGLCWVRSTARGGMNSMWRWRARGQA